MKVDLIIIGNELLNGKIQDLNTHYLASQLYKNGHELRQVKLIKDNENDFQNVMTHSYSHADVIITSGGLGPTKDDLTKRMIADFFNKEIKFNEEAQKIVKSHFDRSNREYNQERMDYNNIPEGFTALYNPAGYAPGLFFESHNKMTFALPGVPLELQAIFENEILKRLQTKQGHSKHLIFKTWKLRESEIFTDLDSKLWNQLEALGEVSSLPHTLGVDIGVKITADDQNELQEKENAVNSVIKESPIHSYIWHYGPAILEEVIVKEAKEKNLKIGFAESCTGGLCASRITDISGSSSVFYGSIISYANDVKINSLNVKPETLKKFGAVSLECAKEMAIGARKTLGVDIAVTTTGIAGPGGGSPEKPVGTVGIGISSAKKDDSKIYLYNGNRKMLKGRFSQIALMTLLEAIREA